MTEMSDAATAALLPCPFCGSEAECAFSYENGRCDIYEVTCGLCDISLSCRYGFEADAAQTEAIATWNTRSDAAQQATAARYQARIDALVGENERLEAVLTAIVDAPSEHGRMIERGAGGMTIDAQIRRSVYNGVPAWPIEEARAALASTKEQGL